MEAHHATYAVLIAAAQRAIDQGLIREAISKAIESWEHIDGMIQFVRKYSKQEIEDIEGIDFVIKFAPLLLDAPSLNKLEVFLDENRRIKRHSAGRVSDQLASARMLINDLHRVWDELETRGEVPEDRIGQLLNGAKGVIDVWQQMGLIRVVSKEHMPHFRIATRMGEIIPCKCPACGKVGQTIKAMALEPTKCPHCNELVLLVMGEVPVFDN